MCRINTLVDPCKEKERIRPSGPTGTYPTLGITRTWISKDLYINQNSMKKKVAYLLQSMKYMADHGEWRIMMKAKEKILSGFNALV